METQSTRYLVASALAASLLVGAFSILDRAAAIQDHNAMRVFADDAMLAMVAPPVGLTLTSLDAWQAR